MPDTEELKEKELEKVAGGDLPCFTMSGMPIKVAASVICTACPNHNCCNNPNKQQ